jgi:putative transposase
VGGDVSSRRGAVIPQADREATKGRVRAERVGTSADGERPAKKIPFRIAGTGARAAQYRAIYHHEEEFEVKAMCGFFGVSRAAYYAWVKRLEKLDPDQERMQQVQAVYEQSHKTYGYRRVTIQLQDKHGLQINHKAVLRLMRKLGIRSVARKPYPYRKVEDLGTYHRYPNVLDRDFVASAPNQKWVTDITYIRLQQGWAFLSIIKDLFDGFIVGYVLHDRNSIALVTRTLQQAKQNEKVTDGLVLHSDQGTQYTSQAYHVLTSQYNITPSMSRRANCWDNAPAENFFSHLKEEYLRHFPLPSFQQAQQLIAEYIHFYNYERIQVKTRQTPFETRCLSS